MNGLSGLPSYGMRARMGDVGTCCDNPCGSAFLGRLIARLAIEGAPSNTQAHEKRCGCIHEVLPSRSVFTQPIVTRRWLD